MTIGERIKAAREQAKVTQTELGERIGVSGVAIMRYEKDKRQPRLEQLQAIAEALGVPLDQLLGIERLHIPMPEYPLYLPSKEELDRLSWQEREYLTLRLFADTAPERLKSRLVNAYGKLNKLGQVEAVRRTEELAEIPRYTAQEPPQPTGEGTNTPPPSDAPTEAPEGA